MRTADSGDVAILMYHSIADDSSPEFADFVVPPTVFAAQVAALAEAGLRTITMSELAVIRSTERPVPDDTVVLTFDDGFLDFAESALPVLRAHDFTATVYVTSRFVGGRSRWLAPDGEPDRRMLGWAELADMVSSGIEIGAHTDTHPHLDLVTERVMARELVVPKVALEDRLGVPVTSMAYPFGYADRSVRAMTQHLGYDNACIVSDLVSTANDDPYAVPRLTVTRRHSPDEVVMMTRSHPTRVDRIKAGLRRHASRTLRTAGIKKPESGAYSRTLS